MSLEDQYEVKLYPKRGITLARGEGCYIFDTNGKKYLDFMTNIGVNILGYTNPTITKAIAQQIEALPSAHQTFYSKSREDFLKVFIDILPKPLEKVIFTNSGAEAVEAALKLTMAATGKSGFISAINSYHGRTLGSLSVTGQQKYKKLFLPVLDRVQHVPFNDVAALEKSIAKDTAAVILEPIQGEAGFILPNKDYLKSVQALCQSYGVLLIFDEIQSAIRTGTWLSSEQYGVVPDIVCLSKSLSYGIPFGVVATTALVSSCMPKGAHGSTFAGNPIASVAATEVLKAIATQNLLTNASEMGEYFLGNLKKLRHPAIVEVRGKGLMIGIEINQPTTPFLKTMQDKGLIASSSSSQTIRFLPPITTAKAHIDEAMGILTEVFS